MVLRGSRRIAISITGIAFVRSASSDQAESDHVIDHMMVGIIIQSALVGDNCLIIANLEYQQVSGTNSTSG
jgi:hypothetical protein